MRFGSKLDEKNVRLFLSYQLLSLFSFTHSRLLFHGNLRPSSICIVKDMWMLVSGFQVSDNFKVLKNIESTSEFLANVSDEEYNDEEESARRMSEETDKMEPSMVSAGIPEKEVEEVNELTAGEHTTFLESSSLHGMRIRTPSIVEQWVNGKMSNFDYLMAINELAGRHVTL